MKNPKAIILLFIANTISGFSQGISMIAIPWFLINELGEANLHSTSYFLVTLVSLFWGPYAGTLIDKYSRKTIFLLTNVVGALFFLSGAFICYHSSVPPVFILAGLFATTFLIFNIHYPSLYAFAQELVEPKDYGRITSYIEIQGQITTVTSGAMASFLLKGGSYDLGLFSINIHRWEIFEVFLLDGCTYFATVFVISLIKYTPTVNRKIEQSSLINRFKTGFYYLQDKPYVSLFGVVSFTIFASFLVVNFTVAPKYIENILQADADVYAFHEIFYGIGALLAGFFITKIFGDGKTIKGVMVLHFICGLVYLCFGFIANIPLFLGLVIFLGIGNAGSRILRITYLLKRIPNDVIGRAGSIFMIINVLERMSLIALFSAPFMLNDISNAYIVCAVFCWIALAILAKYATKLNNIPQIANG